MKEYYKVLNKYMTGQQFPAQRREPALNDLEVISLSLITEYMNIDSKNHLFRILPTCFSSKIERTAYYIVFILLEKNEAKEYSMKNFAPSYFTPIYLTAP